MDTKPAYFGKWHLNPHYDGRYLGWDPDLGPTSQGFEVAIEDFGSHPYSQQELPVLQELVDSIRMVSRRDR